MLAAAVQLQEAIKTSSHLLYYLTFFRSSVTILQSIIVVSRLETYVKKIETSTRKWEKCFSNLYYALIFKEYRK